jgi:hypothetical protein
MTINDLARQASDRFQHITRINDSFDVYDNSGQRCYTFSPNGNRFRIGISLTNSEWCVATNITDSALADDVQMFFNLIHKDCCKLDQPNSLLYGIVPPN